MYCLLLFSAAHHPPAPYSLCNLAFQGSYPGPARQLEAVIEVFGIFELSIPRGSAQTGNINKNKYNYVLCTWFVLSALIHYIFEILTLLPPSKCTTLYKMLTIHLIQKAWSEHGVEALWTGQKNILLSCPQCLDSMLAPGLWN